MADAVLPVQTLSSRDPQTGDRLLFRSASWKVTERASYKNEDGYDCVEWTCECGGVEAYLLKETEKGRTHRWFFTLTIDDGKVKLSSGQKVSDCVEKSGKGLSAPHPQELSYRGQNYLYVDKTEGTYTDDSGEKTPKTTWDYWDAGHKNNLAVEIWESGEVDCYLGSYVEAGSIAFSARPNIHSDHHFFSSDVLQAVIYLSLFAFFVLSEVGGAVDQILTFILALLLLGGWMYPVMDAPGVAAASTAIAVAAGVVFWSFPPLGGPLGFLAFVAAPIFQAWLIRKADHTLSDDAARTHIVHTLALPLACLGLAHYFSYAPAPHDFGQYCLALAPAAAGGAAAWALATFMFSDSGPLGPHPLHDVGGVR